MRLHAVGVDADLLEDRRTDVNLLDVAVEGNAEDALVRPVAVVALIGLVEVVEGQGPLGDIFIERLQEALRGEVAEPGREELDGVEAGVAREELGHDLVVHRIVRDGDELDLDAGELREGLDLLLRGFTVGGADGEADGLAGVLLADGFPVDGADPVLLRVPQLIIVAELVLLAIFLLHHVADVDLGQHIGGIGQVLRIGAAHVEQRYAAGAGSKGKPCGGSGLEQRPARGATRFGCQHSFLH